MQDKNEVREDSVFEIKEHESTSQKLELVEFNDNHNIPSDNK